jgi:arylsulfatase A-like enzyme
MIDRSIISRTATAVIVVAVALLQGPAAEAAESSSQPNIVIFLADDQGWGDLSCHGNKNLATPNIDSLAREGTKLENFYVCAVCAPTRAEFLTGRYHFRTGVSGVSEGAGRLNPDETTLADLFHAAGYATGVFGKWHNGTQSPYHPLDRGFDEFYGFTSGHWGHYFSPPLDHNRLRVKGNGYLPNDLTDHALTFIDEHHDEPFLCYVPFNTPHSPFYVDDDFYKKFDGLDPAMRNRDLDKEDLRATRAALAMCENIDWNVGRILSKLDTHGLRENTIVVYFSDNGPNSFRWNGGMKGKKGTVDEGGLRSPFLIRWPGNITAGRTMTEVAGAIDLLPTLAALTQVPAETAKPIDGRSFAELLLGDSTSLGDSDAVWPDRQLFSVWRKRVTVRTEQFRLDERGSLFDIQKDRGQHHDVANEHPDLARRLREVVAAHRAEVVEHFAANADRPFTVGYAESTTLPARDGVPHGTIQRSSKAPNNSFFTNWTRDDDSITWDIEVGTAGQYRATVFYTCRSPNVGATVRLACGKSSTQTTVTEVFDPPTWDKSKERVAESHYFVKDFKPLELGVLTLKEGRDTLTLTAPKLVAGRGIDVYSVVLRMCFGTPTSDNP